VTGGGVVLVVSLAGLGGPALSRLLGINVFSSRLSSRGSDSGRRCGALRIRAREQLLSSASKMDRDILLLK
jgi:hypothetical protein